MRQARSQKRPKRIVTLGAVLAASALLSAFQPASALVPPNETGYAGTYVQQGDFEIHASVFEEGGRLCAWIRKVSTGESRQTCAFGHDVEVSDDLGTAWGRGTLEWVSASSKSRGSKTQTSYKYGTFSLDVTWTGTGITTTNFDDGVTCTFPGWDDGGWCPPDPSVYQWRSATWSGTITDSEWGTFVLYGSGDLYQELIGT